MKARGDVPDFEGSTRSEYRPKLKSSAECLSLASRIVDRDSRTVRRESLRVPKVCGKPLDKKSRKSSHRIVKNTRIKAKVCT